MDTARRWWLCLTKEVLRLVNTVSAQEASLRKQPQLYWMITKE